MNYYIFAWIYVSMLILVFILTLIAIKRSSFRHIRQYQTMPFNQPHEIGYQSIKQQLLKQSSDDRVWHNIEHALQRQSLHNVYAIKQQRIRHARRFQASVLQFKRKRRF